jgi:hypothetical protein
MRSEIKEIVLKPELIVQKSWGLAWHKEVDVKGMGNPLCLSGQGLASTGRPNESSVEGFSGSDFSKWLPAIRQEYRSQGGGAKKTISSLDKPG